MQNIEIEIRSFIPESLYYKLIDFFGTNATLIKEEFQETHYFDCEQDLRIQKRDHNAKIWMKQRKIHENAREETEIIINKEDFEKIKKVFNEIGLNTQIIWLRNRKQFNWNEIKVCLDYTKGYGHIIELEILASEDQREFALEQLKQKLQELNVPLTPKEIFDSTYQYYKENWRSLIENAP